MTAQGEWDFLAIGQKVVDGAGCERRKPPGTWIYLRPGDRIITVTPLAASASPAAAAVATAPRAAAPAVLAGKLPSREIVDHYVLVSRLEALRPDLPVLERDQRITRAEARAAGQNLAGAAREGWIVDQAAAFSDGDLVRLGREGLAVAVPKAYAASALLQKQYASAAAALGALRLRHAHLVFGGRSR